MIVAAYEAAKVWLAGLPAGMKWIAAGVATALLLVLLWFLWLGHHDKQVIQQSDEHRSAQATKALDTSAEERAIDAVTNATAEAVRKDAIDKAAASEAAKPPEQRAPLPPTTIALNCARLLRSYSAAELATMPAYQEKCR